MADIYREILIDRLENPIKQGTLTAPDLHARLVNPLCGDEVLLQLKTKNGFVEQAVYSGNGCAISQVSASFLTENIQGQKLSKIKEFSENDILKWLGTDLAPARLKCAFLSLEVLKKLIDEKS